MMGKQSGQLQMVILDIDSMIPEDHLLRRIKNCVNFDFIYEKAAPLLFLCCREPFDRCRGPFFNTLIVPLRISISICISCN